MDISYPPNKLGNFSKCFTLAEEKRGWGFSRKGQRRKFQCNPRLCPGGNGMVKHWVRTKVYFFPLMMYLKWQPSIR
jgi:hypothetical protein